MSLITHPSEGKLYKCISLSGKPEVADQIEVTKKLVDLYDFIDRKNVAIWGWSYGGGSIKCCIIFCDFKRNHTELSGIKKTQVHTHTV